MTESLPAVAGSGCFSAGWRQLPAVGNAALGCFRSSQLLLEDPAPHVDAHTAGNSGQQGCWNPLTLPAAQSIQSPNGMEELKEQLHPTTLLLPTVLPINAALQTAPVQQGAAHSLPCVCGALLHRGGAAGGSSGKPGRERQQGAEGPREAWQHLKHDLQDPHDWDRATEAAFEGGALGRSKQP